MRTPLYLLQQNTGRMTEMARTSNNGAANERQPLLAHPTSLDRDATRQADALANTIRRCGSKQSRKRSREVMDEKEEDGQHGKKLNGCVQAGDVLSNIPKASLSSTASEAYTPSHPNSTLQTASQLYRTVSSQKNVPKRPQLSSMAGEMHTLAPGNEIRAANPSESVNGEAVQASVPNNQNVAAQILRIDTSAWPTDPMRQTSRTIRPALDSLVAFGAETSMQFGGVLSPVPLILLPFGGTVELAYQYSSGTAESTKQPGAWKETGEILGGGAEEEMRRGPVEAGSGIQQDPGSGGADSELAWSRKLPLLVRGAGTRHDKPKSV